MRRSSSVVPGSRGSGSRQAERTWQTAGRRRRTGRHMTWGSQWQPPGTVIHRRYSGPTPRLSEGEIKRLQCIKHVVFRFSNRIWQRRLRELLGTGWPGRGGGVGAQTAVWLFDQTASHHLSDVRVQSIDCLSVCVFRSSLTSPLHGRLTWNAHSVRVGFIVGSSTCETNEFSFQCGSLWLFLNDNIDSKNNISEMLGCEHLGRTLLRRVCQRH